MSVVNQNEKCLGGIFIIPVGFFLSPREMDVHCRHCFLSKYKITRVKYFEEVVFPDTTTTVVAFSFVKSDKLLSEQNIPWERYPNGDKKIFKLESKHKWIIGGEIYDLKIPKIKTNPKIYFKKCPNCSGDLQKRPARNIAKEIDQVIKFRLETPRLQKPIGVYQTWWLRVGKFYFQHVLVLFSQRVLCLQKLFFYRLKRIKCELLWNATHCVNRQKHRY